MNFSRKESGKKKIIQVQESENVESESNASTIETAKIDLILDVTKLRA